jgi:hypothetical protein
MCERAGELNKLEAIRLLLHRWGQALLAIEDKQKEISGFQAMIDAAYDTLRASKITGMPRGGYSELNAVESAADNAGGVIKQYKAAIDRLTNQISELINFRQAMGDCIDALDADERRIVRLRYEADQPWGYIESKMRTSRACLAWKESQLLVKLKSRIDIQSQTEPGLTIFAQTNIDSLLKTQTNPDKSRQTWT